MKFWLSPADAVHFLSFFHSLLAADEWRVEPTLCYVPEVKAFAVEVDGEAETVKDVPEWFARWYEGVYGTKVKFL